MLVKVVYEIKVSVFLPKTTHRCDHTLHTEETCLISGSPCAFNRREHPQEITTPDFINLFLCVSPF